ncbi:Uncharacterised protein [Vibrio cholerae]|nr:Uncharacterised protein [Vibrio cholerae]CSA82809.1 Uncharacterised protein [Vibrio cholerae]CSA96133.1 Uncharacterised protein [Vibrio cholerae]
MAISRVPMIAARKGDSPSLIWRSTFSRTTIASSTTRPIARTIASSVIRFQEKPIICITIATPISESGIVTIGMSTARSEPKNRVMTTRTISAASTMVLITSWIDSLIATVESYNTFISMLLGMFFCSSGSISSTSLAMLIGFALGAALIAATTASRPLALAR